MLLLAYAAGGAIVNVAVAWGLYVFEIGPRGPAFVPNQPPTTADIVWWQRHAPNTFVRKPTDLVVAKSFPYSVDHLLVQTGRTSTQVVMRMAAGLPTKCFQGAVWTDTGATSPRPLIQEGMIRPQWSESLKSRGIPAGILWPGFAINTISYALILWLLFAAPAKIRRIIRARRGQCTACAYPIGSSTVCTECGASTDQIGSEVDLNDSSTPSHFASRLVVEPDGTCSI